MPTRRCAGCCGGLHTTCGVELVRGGMTAAHASITRCLLYCWQEWLAHHARDADSITATVAPNSLASPRSPAVTATAQVVQLRRRQKPRPGRLLQAIEHQVLTAVPTVDRVALSLPVSEHAPRLYFTVAPGTSSTRHPPTARESMLCNICEKYPPPRAACGISSRSSSISIGTHVSSLHAPIADVPEKHDCALYASHPSWHAWRWRSPALPQPAAPWHAAASRFVTKPRRCPVSLIQMCCTIPASFNGVHRRRRCACAA